MPTKKKTLREQKAQRHPSSTNDQISASSPIEPLLFVEILIDSAISGLLVEKDFFVIFESTLLVFVDDVVFPSRLNPIENRDEMKNKKVTNPLFPLLLHCRRSKIAVCIRKSRYTLSYLRNRKHLGE